MPESGDGFVLTRVKPGGYALCTAACSRGVGELLRAVTTSVNGSPEAVSFGPAIVSERGDVVIVSFAGHGSADGRLVFHDTDAANLSDTALSMTVLADAFKSTKARAVLCLLDCCFSGHAPARVLETEARPRSPFALNGVHGEGRILISACASTEAAWEQPGTGHGLLTYAVIEALTRESHDIISFPGIADEIISLARPTTQR